jgi:hypothetical protein
MTHQAGTRVAEARTTLQHLLTAVADSGDPLETSHNHIATYRRAVVSLGLGDVAELQIRDEDLMVEPRLPRPYLPISVFRNRLQQALEASD